jgi:CubicO group peptidase (beta-lactamase class C family)
LNLMRVSSWAFCKRAVIAIMVSLAIFQAGLATAETLNPVAVAQIDSAAARYILAGSAPGVSVAVMRKARLVFKKGYGYENLETMTPVTAETVFRVGSITKMFTAAAVLRLTEEGRLSVDDPVSKYISELAAAGPLTLRMLLTQTSGLHDYTHTPAFGEEQRNSHTTKQMIDYIASMKPLTDFAAGSKWAYSNSNYYVLGAIVEKVSGASLGQYLETNIIAPAGITTTVADREDDVVLHRASGYVPVEGKSGHFRNAPFFSMDNAGGAGALRSTAVDLARWQQALFAGRIITLRSVAAMTTPGRLNDGAIAIRPDAPISLGPPSYGFGLELGTVDGEQAIGHGGSVPGFTSYLVTFPKLQMTVAIMTNGAPNGADVFHDIERAVLHAGRN